MASQSDDRSSLPAISVGELVDAPLSSDEVFNSILRRSFEENAFSEEERSLYRSIFDRVVNEFAVRPGFNTTHLIMAQRIAWIQMLIMKRDGSPRGDALYWSDYSKLNASLRDFLSQLREEGKQADVELTFKRDLFRLAAHTFRDIVDGLKLSDAAKVDAGNRFASLLAERLRA